MKDIHLKNLNYLFERHFGQSPKNQELLPLSGSNRFYYRLSGNKGSLIGTVNDDVKENEAFISFTETFKELGLPVPQVQDVSEDNISYLQSDLGDTTLFAFLKEKRTGQAFPAEVIAYYKKVLSYLPKFQLLGGKHINFSKCYPRAAFDRQSMMWDLNYFKYYFLKLSGVTFDEQLLENDYDAFTDFLLEAPGDYFLYRDFQSRNIMLLDNEVFFIDYQGGRRGPLQYDLASLLYDAKANIPEELRQELLEYYLDQLEKHMKVDRSSFTQYFYGYVLIRIMQAMGAYGYRGFYERKAHFLQSIPYALKNLNLVLKKWRLPGNVTYLPELLEQLPDAPGLKKYTKEIKVKTLLTININSFSYKKSLPEDTSGNGGGYIFDCRSIHNPGRYDEYKSLTGRDQPVIDFLKKEGETDAFLNSVIQLSEQSIDKYLDRGFTNLQINFGCTGGQHRSVYCAENLARHLKSKYENKIKIKLKHREQNIEEEL